MSSKILFFSTIFVAFFTLFRPINSDIGSDRSTLLAIRSALRGRSLLWNVTSPTCSWPGVICSPDKSSVVELHLPGMGLLGQIPPGLFSNLTKLNFLSLRYNALSGVIPSDLFSSLHDLRNLYLQHNLFSGPIPDSIFSLTNLVRLNLAHNNFSGSIPESFNNLTSLGTLYLQGNGFAGQLPDLNLPALVQFNVSDNQLNGSIPSKLSGQPKEAFLGTSLCGKPLDLCDGSSSSSTNGEGKKKKLSGGAIAGIVIGCVLGLLLLLCLLFLCCRKRGNKETRSADVGAVNKQVEVEIPEERGVESNGGKDGFLGSAIAAIGVGGGTNRDKGKADAVVNDGKSLVFFGKMAKNFNLDDLLKASAEVLGKGTFGTAYKAALESGITLVVKRLRDVTVPEKEFREKIEDVGKMNHENLVPLRAYYYSRDEKLLVYDYVPMGSLSALLHGENNNFFSVILFHVIIMLIWFSLILRPIGDYTSYIIAVVVVFHVIIVP